jgi:hypothetical protein
MSVNIQMTNVFSKFPVFLQLPAFWVNVQAPPLLQSITKLKIPHPPLPQ